MVLRLAWVKVILSHHPTSFQYETNIRCVLTNSQKPQALTVPNQALITMRKDTMLQFPLLPHSQPSVMQMWQVLIVPKSCCSLSLALALMTNQ